MAGTSAKRSARRSDSSAVKDKPGELTTFYVAHGDGSGNLLSVASVHKRWLDKTIIIAGDDDHRIENNPGREKALAATKAVAGVAIFPKFSGEHRLWGFADFNDLALSLILLQTVTMLLRV